ncbi:hypothetical protein D3C86_2201100 [compost metagenome]
MSPKATRINGFPVSTVMLERTNIAVDIEISPKIARTVNEKLSDYLLSDYLSCPITNILIPKPLLIHPISDKRKHT